MFEVKKNTNTYIEKKKQLVYVLKNWRGDEINKLPVVVVDGVVVCWVETVVMGGGGVGGARGVLGTAVKESTFCWRSKTCKDRFCIMVISCWFWFLSNPFSFFKVLQHVVAFAVEDSRMEILCSCSSMFSKT